MSAATKLELVDAGLPADVAEAAIKRMEEDSHIIRGLRMQNERLRDERLNAELEASVAIAKAKFSQAQLYQRLLDIESRLAELAKLVDGQAQFLAGDYQLLKDRVDGIAAREVI